MKGVMPEKEFQRLIIEHLVEDGYEVRPAAEFNRRYAFDTELLLRFLNDTQPQEMAALRKIYKGALDETLINFINVEITKRGGSLLNVLKKGVEISNMKLELMYTKPATTYNAELTSKYEKNIFSVMEEVWASDSERIDLVVFLNGLAIMTFELKADNGQTYEDAIYQYRTCRDPQDRLFMFKAGVLVNFAMDLFEVHMTTHLEKENTFFHPFNKGRGEGVNASKGNPLYEDKYSVAYMWEDILTKDTVLDLISRFLFIKRTTKTDNVTGKEQILEELVFPRYHQLDLIRKIVADVKENKTSQNYLIEHSAGSGKTNSIAWLAHRLVSLHDDEDQVIFDNVIIVSDRIVVDRQLQRAVMGIDHKSGLIQVMDEKCDSGDLARAIEHNTKIIVTTIQKFPYILDRVKSLKTKKFAVIIDEAHSSTSGKDMAAVTQSLGSDEDLEMDVEEQIVDEIRRTGKQSNVAMFGFTATPKPTTIQLFGRVNRNGQKEAFHVYTMKQAIEEGYILDVLENYTTYETFYQICSLVKEDPKLKISDTIRQMVHTAKLEEENILQRLEIIVEHFRSCVMKELDGTAKAMVVTSSRQEAVKYRMALDKYIHEKGYTDVHALVAFSGKVTFKDSDIQYTEAGMNGFAESKLPDEFKKDTYNILLVANKYQTGYDQDKLCAMYILKKLNGVAAVQTLSRLNRTCLPYDKHVFVLDFVNSYDDIEKAFAPYYTTTLLSNCVNPQSVYDLEARIDAYYVLDPLDIDKYNDLMYGNNDLSNSQVRNKIREFAAFCQKKAQKAINALGEKEKNEALALLRRFVRFYEFLLQVSGFEDVELHKKYRFISDLLKSMSVRHSGPGYSLDGKIKAINFIQKKKDEHVGSNIVAQPIVKLTLAEKEDIIEPKEEYLSKIIDEINSRMGKNFDSDIITPSIEQILGIIKGSAKIKPSAMSNSLNDFAFTFYTCAEDALIKGREQNTEFYDLLLKNEDIQKEILGIYLPGLYKRLRGENVE